MRLVSIIDLKKDVDGLNPRTLEAVITGDWQDKGLVVPATAKAVFTIINEFLPDWRKKKTMIIGKSDLVGKPLYFLLKQKTINNRQAINEKSGEVIRLTGRNEFQELLSKPEKLKKFDIIVSATGKPDLIDASMIKKGVALIDVGEPKGDINPNTYKKASFYTPVPGGVGPVTVVSLMENGVVLLPIH